jgi:hypothetical protein
LLAALLSYSDEPEFQQHNNNAYMATTIDYAAATGDAQELVHAFEHSAEQGHATELNAGRC